MSEPKPIAVVIPASLWDSDGTEEAILAEWHTEDGATVEEADPLAEVMVDKVSMLLEAPASGMLEIRTPPETPIALGAIIAVIHPR